MFPTPIDFKSCREEIAGDLQEFCYHWRKRERVESNALNSWKLNIFKIIDGRILQQFRSSTTNLRHLKNGIQEFHRKFVLAPADNTLKQERSTAKTYEHNRLDEASIVDRHRCHMAAKFGLFVDEDHCKLPTLYWLPKLRKWPYKSRLITYSNACTTTGLSILLTSCLTAIKIHVIKYCTTVYERNGKNCFGLLKI